MAHHKSAKERIRRNERAHVANRAYLGSVRTAIKNFRGAADEAAKGNKSYQDIQPLFKKAQSILQKAARKRVIHPNQADRKIGRLGKILKLAENGDLKPGAVSQSPTKRAKKKGGQKKRG